MLLPIVWRWVSTKNIYICLKLAKSTDTCASDCVCEYVCVCECAGVCESQKPIRQSQRKSTKGKFILDSILELLKWRNMCATWNETRRSRASAAAVAAHASASPFLTHSLYATHSLSCHALVGFIWQAKPSWSWSAKLVKSLLGNNNKAIISSTIVQDIATQTRLQQLGREKGGERAGAWHSTRVKCEHEIQFSTISRLDFKAGRF